MPSSVTVTDVFASKYELCATASSVTFLRAVSVPGTVSHAKRRTGDVVGEGVMLAVTDAVRVAVADGDGERG